MKKDSRINKIYEALLNRADKISDKQEIEKIIKEYNKAFNSKMDIEMSIKYLSRHCYIKRIFLNFYYINSVDERKRKYCKYGDKELLFLVLNKIDADWYLGLSSALYESGKSWQIPMVVNIINNKYSGLKKILGLHVRFYKINEKLIFGIKQRKTKNKIKYFYSPPSKTYIDMVYLRASDKLVRDKETKKYIKFFPRWVEKK